MRTVINHTLIFFSLVAMAFGQTTFSNATAITGTSAPANTTTHLSIPDNGVRSIWNYH